MYRILTLISVFIIFSTFLSAQTVTVLPSIKDNSMFSESGNLSVGVGRLFTGRTCQGNNRRALIEFDLTSIPTDAVVSSVSLNLGTETSGNNADGVIEIFGITREWGEGFSSGSGQGGPAMAPDATWTDAMFGTVSWDTEGGDFDPALLTSRFTTENNQTISFPSSANFITQAQTWINDPSSNHGIIVIGIEDQTCAAYRFGSRDQGTVPELVVTWESPGCVQPVVDLTIEACESYTSPGGTTFTDSGMFTEEVSGPNNCDTIFNIDLTILLPGEFLIITSICEDDDFTLNGVVYDIDNPSGIQEFTAANGCDSTIIIDLSFIANSAALIEETLCSNDGFSLVVNGTVFDIDNPSGVEELVNFSGCDSIVTIDLTFLPTGGGVESYLGCEGDGFSVVVNGTLYDESQPFGTETLLGASANGCDSIVNINLVFQESVTENITHMGCEGNGFSVEVDGVIYDEFNPVGTVLLTSSFGCDSIVNIDLFFAPTPNSGIPTIPGSLCNEDDTALNLNTLLTGADAGGVWTETSPNPSTGLSGNQFDATGQNPGTYFFRYTVSAINCPDEFTQVTVNVQTPLTAVVTPTGSVCNNNNAGNITFFDFNSLITAGFADGVWIDTDGVGVDLTNFSSVDFAGVVEGSFTFTYFTSVIGNCPAQSFPVTILVEDCVCPSTTTNVNNTGCEGDGFEVIVNGVVFNEANPSGTEILVSTVTGCDSIVNINLVFNSPATSEGTFSTCDLSTPPTTTVVIANGAFNGCDSIIIITTIYLDNDETAIFDSSCNPVDTGTVEITLINQFGCDSIVTTTTTLLPSDETAVFASSCDPDEVGVVTITLSNQFGCDSIVTITTMLLPSDETAIFASSCDPDEVGVVTENLINQFGCDSIVMTTTMLLPSDTLDIFEVSCNPADTGTVVLNLFNQNGCDSIVTTVTEFTPLDNSVTVSDASLVATIIGATYQWIDCDNNNAPIMGETDRVFMATTSGNYAVEIMQDGCMTTSECVMVTVVNTEDVWFADQIDVLPNPTSGAIRLTFGELENVNIRVMGVTGKVMLERTNLSGEFADLFLEGPAGLYFVGVEVDGKWGWMKVVKN